MRRTTTSIILGSVCAVVATCVWPSVASSHGAKAETYTAEAPSPSVGADPEGCLSLEEPCSEFDGCANASEGVSKESHPFQMPNAGRLTVEMSDFSGDWDLYVFNADGPRRVRRSGGDELASSTRDSTFTVEAVSVLLLPNQAVDIVACNFSGGPTATVSFAFVRLPVVSVGDVTVHEGDSGSRSAVFSVSLSEPSTSSVTVEYRTDDDSATPPGDYTQKSGTLTFVPGSTNAMVKVAVIGDTVDESSEFFHLEVFSVDGRAVVADRTPIATILDDDPASVATRLAIGDTTVHEGDSGGRATVFNVSLSQPSGSTVTVSFATAKGTATGADFTAKSGTLSFAPGATSLNVKVPITADDTVEGDESFSVKLSAANGATIADATGVGTIIDND